MRCPFCQSDDTQVKDSRPTEDNSSIRRRRACNACGGRFTTFERIQLRDLMVVKSDDKRQAFDREKVIKSMQVALQKRPVSTEQIEKAVTGIVRQLESDGNHEFSSKYVGDLVMKALANLDMVGYIRYTSVYKDFRDPEDFNAFLEEVRSLQEEQNSKSKKK
jgi:transcriptional repressor NrdR